MNKLGDLSCNEFLTELASAAPAPGGGGGAAERRSPHPE